MRQARLAVVLAAAAAMLGGCRVATLGLGESQVTSGDGLGLHFNLTGKLVAVSTDKKELGQPLTRLIPVVGQAGFYIRERGSLLAREHVVLGKVTPIENGITTSGELAGMRLSADIVGRSNCVLVSGSMANLRKSARHVTVGLSLPVNGSGWVFADDLLATEAIRSLGRYAVWEKLGDAETNRDPFTAIYNERVGLAVGALPRTPQPFRVSYKQDEGLIVETELDLPGGAKTTTAPEAREFSFVVFRFKPNAGYRAALEQYYKLCLAPSRDIRLSAAASPLTVEQLARARALAGLKPSAIHVNGATAADPAQLARMLAFGAVPADDVLSGNAGVQLADQLAKLGWHPQTCAKVIAPELIVERFGGCAKCDPHFTVHNRGGKPVDYEMAIDLPAMGRVPAGAKVVEMLSHQPADASTVEQMLLLKARIAPGQTQVFHVTAASVGPFPTTRED